MASSSLAGNAGSMYRADRLSSSPTAQPSMNKRDKRRIVLQDRYNEIVGNFAANRDAHYRKQLQQYQTDISYIMGAHLYDKLPLPEPGEQDVEQPQANGGRGHRQSHQELTNGATRSESTPKLGKHATYFTYDAINAVEQRDADLVTLAYRHNFNLHESERDYTFSVQVAERERERLLESLRQRLVHNVNQKMAALQREKEKLDIADTNALLHHPTQFSINNVASPGGLQSNRKTRHTRHRMEAEEMEANLNSNNGGKRKRRTAAENDNGSPGPSTSREAEQNASSLYRDTQTRTGIPTAPTVYTLDRLFSDRELTANLQQATYDVIQSYSTSSSFNKRRKPNQAAVNGNADFSASANADTNGADDDGLVTQDVVPTISAPDGMTDGLASSVAMDRTPSQLYHATRSAGRLLASTNPQSTLGELAGRQSAADLIGSYGRGSEKAKKDGDEYQRAPPLSEQEALDDLRLMEAAMKREEEEEDESEEEVEDYEAGAGSRGTYSSRRLLEIVLEDKRDDYVGPKGFAEGIDIVDG